MAVRTSMRIRNQIQTRMKRNKACEMAGVDSLTGKGSRYIPAVFFHIRKKGEQDVFGIRRKTQCGTSTGKGFGCKEEEERVSGRKRVDRKLVPWAFGRICSTGGL